ncbi:iron uptake porin [Acaryochloris marina]|uniref:iron uptake porin n=1 Tax=Acaryochloris marina TaxID=155978 RepID=UPI00067414E2|nr:iron uptake porin [Acaryochloris marina]
MHPRGDSQLEGGSVFQFSVFGLTRLLLWSGFLGVVSGVTQKSPSALAETAPSSVRVPESQRLEEPIIPVWQLEPRESSGPELHEEPLIPVSDESTDSISSTEFSGEAVFSWIQAAGDRQESKNSNEPSFGSRIRLNLETSFSGEDQFRLRLQTTNVVELDDVFDTDLARLSIQGADQYQVSLSRLDYQFPVGEDTEVFVQAIGGSISDIADPLNPLFSSSSRGAISRFGQRNPLYRQGGSTGIGLSHDFNDRINISLGYLGDNQDVFSNEESVAFAQLTLEPADSIRFGLLYTYGLNGLDTGTGSQQANDPFLEQSDAINSHSVGLQGTAKISEQLTLSGWTGYTRATATDLSNQPHADIFNWAFTLGYKNLFRDRTLGGLIIGRPPHVSSDAQPAWHLEVFYQVQLNEHITLTPGIVVITAPDPNRSPIVVGTLRTLFRF